LTIPAEIPGAEAPLIELPKEPNAKERAVHVLYPELPPLPNEPTPLPGPGGLAYTLSDLQEIAAANSTALAQAASDVTAARGNLMQAAAYPNPTVAYLAQPSSNGATAGSQGFSIEQSIKTGGKLKLQAATAEMDLRNAELALRRARSDLATQVRNAYFSILVAKESMRVNRALAHFTDEVYRLQREMLLGGFAAPYEPASLRAQAYSARLAYSQSIQTYIYDWEQLVAALNVRHIPLTEVAGRIDRAIPYYDYDQVLARVLRNHTDVLVARNGLEKARYSLKLAQITPLPDIDVNAGLLKDTAVPPKGTSPTLSVGVPLPIWDTNKGNIIAAESALVRASEEPHRVEEQWKTTIAGAYLNYKNNLDALEFYRRYILPDQVRAYRGAYDRRQVDPNASFGDVVSAQQTLASDVSQYLTILGQLWSAVISVADPLQTDDLFQLAEPKELPPLPDLERVLPPLPCCHPCARPVGVVAIPDSSKPDTQPAEPVQRPSPSASAIPRAGNPPKRDTPVDGPGVREP
jgi:cobalt-zinc-cadmium efflux system outer membrane protein